MIESDFTVAVLDGALPSSVTLTLDILRAANRLSQIRGGPALHWRVLASQPRLALGDGLFLETTPMSSRSRLGKSALIIPGVAMVAPTGLRFDPSNYALRFANEDARCLATLAANHHRNGGVVASSCSSAFVLGQAGLLDGHTATTHWRLAPCLQQMYPASRIDAQRTLVTDDRLLTAGGALAHVDLMLHLVRERLGSTVTDLAARYLLLDEHSAQTGYTVWSHLHGDNPDIRVLEQWVEDSLPTVPSIRTLAEKLHVSEKTLARRIRKATGKTPIDLVQSVRLRRAHHLLANTRLSLQEVATQVGYADATALRKLTLKALQATPGRLRSDPLRHGPTSPSIGR